MITVECSVCHRQHEKEGDTGGKISHTYCARCGILSHKDDLYDSEDEMRKDLKEQIKRELDAGIVWEGDDQSNFSDEDQRMYDEVLAEVRRELGEGENIAKR